MIKRIPIRVFAGLAILVLAANIAAAQSTIVLRDLTLIQDQEIESFNRNAIELTNGTKLSWDMILRADVGQDRQKEFDRNVIEIGLPLFRLKSRIRLGDWPGAGSIAEPMFEKHQPHANSLFSKNVEYLVCLATMKSRLKTGDRASAVLPFLRALEIQPNVDSATLELVGSNRFPDDQEIALAPELLPVWFDIESVASSVKQIKAEKNISPSLSRSIFLASMYIELDRNEDANALIVQIKNSNSNSAKRWSIVLRSRLLQRSGEQIRCQALLDQNANEFTEGIRAVATYYRALSEMQRQLEGDIKNEASDVLLSRSALMFIRIPAIYGKEHPYLAAAALFQAAKIAELRGRPQEAQKLTQQLLRQHAQTYHGSIATSQSGKIPAH